MKHLYKSIVFELTLYYLLLVFCLPLVYAVTYQLSFAEVYNLEWFSISLFCSPLIFVFSTVRYGYQRMRKIRN